jgi:hypothetical protein
MELQSAEVLRSQLKAHIPILVVERLPLEMDQVKSRHQVMDLVVPVLRLERLELDTPDRWERVVPFL